MLHMVPCLFAKQFCIICSFLIRYGFDLFDKLIMNENKMRRDIEALKIIACQKKTRDTGANYMKYMLDHGTGTTCISNLLGVLNWTSVILLAWYDLVRYQISSRAFWCTQLP
uniref:Uncharacterized protein n=1 Tax=Pararge aegeria TaxID=116150 RepID=S4NN51_9NEOP